VAPPPLPSQIYFLDLDQVIEIHDNLLVSGEDPSVLNMPLLEQAVASPQGGHSRGYYNLNLFEMAAALIIGLANNHPFANGNKRTAMISGNIFLSMNDYELNVDDKCFVKCIIDVVTKRMNKAQLTKFLWRRAKFSRFTEESTRIQRRTSTPNG
jgi:death-on-curing protein